MAWDRCRNGFWINIRRNNECLKIGKFLVKICECLKGPQGPLWHEIDVDKMVFGSISGERTMSTNSKILGRGGQNNPNGFY